MIATSRTRFDSNLLNEKKKRFLDAVKRAAKALNTTEPEVNFWITPCPQNNSETIAHIHLDTNIVCISEARLISMRYDEIDHTATHEVAHLVEANHSPDFERAQNEIKVKTWKPPGGVVVIKGGNNESTKTNREQKLKIDKKHCNYHLCQKRKPTLQCPYCNRYFCAYHYAPKPIGIINIGNSTYEELKNWRRDDAHPCFGYMQEYEEEKKKKMGKITENMNKMNLNRGVNHRQENEDASNDLRKDGWTIDLGVNHRQENEDASNKQIEDAQSYCNYHLCKKIGPTFQCQYCRRNFCSFHHKAKPPSVMDIAGASSQELDEWRKEDAHPCYEYYQEYEQMKKREQERLRENMTKLKGRPIEEPQFPVNTIDSHNSKEEDSRPNLFKWLFFIVVAIIILSSVYFVTGTQISKIVNGLIEQTSNSFQNLKDSRGVAKNCTNTLASGQCSENQPFYCNDGKLEENSDTCGCPTGQRAYQKSCILAVYCSDGSMNPDCSQNKPLKCINGTLVDKASECGCPTEYKIEGEKCKFIQRCTDGTIYDECSQTKPFYCNNGVLVKKATLCNCSVNTNVYGDECIEKYKTEPDNRVLRYVLDGEVKETDITVYKGLRNILTDTDRTYSCYEGSCPTQEEINNILEGRRINNEQQQKEIHYLTDKIRDITNNSDDQARIAISMVQNIPYDYTSLNTGLLKGRYPYEVLYENIGVCGEKAPLLAVMLKELGFGVVLFDFSQESHEAVGIKCPLQYSFRSSGYCFIESTTPSIITDDQGDYTGVGKLTTSTTITVSDGISFDSVSREYNDAQVWRSIEIEAKSRGNILDSDSYSIWSRFVKKYGLKTS